MATFRIIAILLLAREYVTRPLLSQTAPIKISGTVSDPQSNPVPGAAVTLSNPQAEIVGRTRTDSAGHFEFPEPHPGAYTLKVYADGFDDAVRSIAVTSSSPASFDIQLGAVSHMQQSVTVTADVKNAGILFPDPGQRVYVRQETLDANPGRPGTPISVPGLPAETASGGIKAPQYFAPGVAGDHGEPIAQYLQVGSYLVPNNLSSNAHGNGYADPNIMVPAMLEGVQTDGGAFNVREGNHAENLSAIYELRSRLTPFVTVTGDYRDMDIVAGWSPEKSEVKSWVAIEAAYGDGFLQRLENRQQYKMNAYRVWEAGQHQITLFGIGYYGRSYVPGLAPLGVPGLHDTIDPRQRDQTHTGELAINDDWKLSSSQELQISGMFRTYNLALLSNFGDGLIRQSEFRTVTGGNTSYIKQITRAFSLLAGVDYQRDAPRRLDLDHYSSTYSTGSPTFDGPFEKVTANNVTLGDTASYLALSGSLSKYLRYYAGWRRDEIAFDNTDLLFGRNSYSTTEGFNSPKATVSFVPGEKSWLPQASLSFGEAFYTNDPRIGTGTARGTPISREHAYQLVLSKSFAGVDLRATFGHMTTEASLEKIDPDTGLQQDQGPGRNRFITLAARRYFGFGLLQASVSKADARDLDTGLPTPEAPRTIIDVLSVVNRLPLKLQARVEYEEVGRKPLGDGFVSVPVREFRGALLRTFLDQRVDVGVNFLIASGYTGQTTEVLAVADQTLPLEQVTGVRLPSYVSLSCTWRFRPHP